MNFSPIIIVGGEPQSVFIEILFKAIKNTVSDYFNLIKKYTKSKY